MEEGGASLRGEEVRQEFEPDAELPIHALIPEDYVPEVQQRLFFYKRLASATTEEALYEVKGELRDQCGEPPPEVDALVEVMSLKNELRALRMRGLKSGPGRLVVQLGPDAPLEAQKLDHLVAKGKGKYRLTPGMELVASTGESNVLESARSLLRDLRNCSTPEA